MKNVLWSQDSKFSGVSTFVIDGIVSSYDSREEQNNAYSQLSKIAVTIKSVPGLRAQLKMSNNRIFVTGYFNERDEAGRAITFMFMHIGKDIDEAMKVLQQYAQQIDRSLDAKVINDLNQQFELIQRNYIFRNVAVSFVLIAVFATIVYLAIKNH